MSNTKPKYDVVILEIATRKIDTMAGEGMNLDTGHFNAVRRYETVSPRLNDSFIPAIVTAGKYRNGDVVSQEDIDNQP